MSQSETKRQRTNFTAPRSNEYDPDREPLDDSRPEHSRETASSSGSNKDEWIALGILLDGATRYCYNCEEERDVETELDMRELCPRECEGRRDVTPATALKWTCDVCGYQSHGGILEDRPIPEFLDVVDEVLDAIGGVPSSRRRELRGEALSRKRSGVDDRANLTVLLSEL